MRQHPRSPQTDVAIVGSGFSGLAMAVRAEARRPRRLRRPRARPRRRRHLARQHLSGLRLRRPQPPLLVLVRPEPDWSSTFSPQPEIRAYLRKVADDEGLLAPCPLRLRGRGGAAGTRRRSAGGSRPRRASSPRASLVAGAGPLSSRRSPTSRACATSRARLPLRDVGPRPRPRPASASRWSAPARARSSSCRRSSRGRASCTSSSARRRGSCRARPAAHPVERALYRRFPAAQRRCAAAIYWGRELFAIPMLRAGAGPADPRDRGERHLRRQVPDRELRGSSRPDYAPGCKRILVSNDYLPGARPSRTSRCVTEGIAEVREHIGRQRRRQPSARSTRSSSAPASTSPTCRSPSASATRDGRSLAEHWDGSLAGAPRHDGRRLPEPVLPARPEHRPRPQLGRLHGRGAGRLRRCRRCEQLERTGVAALEPAPRGPGRVERRGPARG